MTTLPAHLQSLSPLTDEEAAARALEGDAGAFELLMRRHNQRLFRLARAVLGSDQDAEDAVQESYIRAYAALDRFEGRSSVATWLSRIVFNEALRARAAGRRRLARSPCDETPDRSTPTVEGLERAESRRLAAEALDTLDDIPRAVTMLRLVQGLSTRETAESLDLSETNVKVTLHRAKRRLSEALREHDPGNLAGLFTFDGDRCDRIVAGVFDRIGPEPTEERPGPDDDGAFLDPL